MFILYGVEDIEIDKRFFPIAFYIPPSFQSCNIENISLYNNRQLNIEINNECLNNSPKIADLYDKNNHSVNNSSFVQTQAIQNGGYQLQYIFRKPVNEKNAHYIILKYEY